MNKVNWIVIGVMLLITIVILINQAQTARQMEALNTTLEKLNRTLDRGVAVSGSGSETTTSNNEDQKANYTEQVASGDDVPAPDLSAFDDPTANGLVKLNANFLLTEPATFNSKWLEGTRRLYQSTPRGLNSLLENAGTNSAIDALINDGLCDRDSSDLDRWRSRLATSCIITNDYKTFTFTIRKGIHWQIPPLATEDGYEWLENRVELTAEDFVFYIDMLKNPDVECPHLKTYYDKLEKAEAVDRYTLRVTWSEKLWTNISSTLGLAPLPRHIYLNDESGKPYSKTDVGVRFNKHWFDNAKQHIGVGPYSLEKFVPDDVMVFKRNPSYYGSSHHFEKLEWDFRTKDPHARLTGFLNGSVQVSGLTPEQYLNRVINGDGNRFAKFDENNPLAGRKGELGWEKVKQQSYSYLGWNMRRPLFSDKRVRQALSHAFNRDRIINDVYIGLGKPINTNVHPDTPYANLGLKGYPYDLAEASRLLAEAGWTDSDGDGVLNKEINGKQVPFEFTTKIIANSPAWVKTLGVFEEDLNAIGIRMKVQALEWKELLQTYNDRDFDCISGGWLMSWDVDFKQLWHSKEADEPGSSNFCGFKNERADEIMEALRREFDIDKRMALAKEFQAIIVDEAPYTFFRASESIMVWQNKSVEKRKAIQGVKWTNDHIHPFKRYGTARYWHFAAD